MQTHSKTPRPVIKGDPELAYETLWYHKSYVAENQTVTMFFFMNHVMSQLQCRELYKKGVIKHVRPCNRGRFRSSYIRDFQKTQELYDELMAA